MNSYDPNDFALSAFIRSPSMFKMKQFSNFVLQLFSATFGAQDHQFCSIVVNLSSHQDISTAHPLYGSQLTQLDY